MPTRDLSQRPRARLRQSEVDRMLRGAGKAGFEEVRLTIDEAGRIDVLFRRTATDSPIDEDVQLD
ncbi:hypothetical protein [Novosphingobium aquae]|uniref:DUF2292 domain-containing protein n=1 Tax=Novosphingobium aquae TaxID=3133435 RepID=A0ABU8S3X3_9SPHN